MKGDLPMSKDGGALRVIKWSADNLREVAPGTVYMKHAYGRDLSVALFRIVSPGGEPAPIPRHSHGEEVNYIIKGSGSLNGVRFEAGDILLIPPGLEHGADTPQIETDRDLVILSIITPPREVYGPEDATANPWDAGETSTGIADGGR